jgi:hypothetical protein
VADPASGLSFRDLCDVVYVLWVDEIERRSVAALAAGAEVDPDAERAKFDKWLDSVPEAVSDPEKFELKQALGLRG